MNSERHGGFFSTIRAVLWSFVGIRRKRDYASDTEHLKPIHLIVAGVLAGVIFVLALVLVVRVVVSSAG